MYYIVKGKVPSYEVLALVEAGSPEQAERAVVQGVQPCAVDTASVGALRRVAFLRIGQPENLQVVETTWADGLAMFNTQKGGR